LRAAKEYGQKAAEARQTTINYKNQLPPDIEPNKTVKASPK